MRISDWSSDVCSSDLGADYAYVGTHFIASEESLAKPGYKQMLVDAEAADIIVTDAFTGIRNSMLRPSIVAAGLDPDNIPPPARGKIAFDDPHKIGTASCRERVCQYV